MPLWPYKLKSIYGNRAKSKLVHRWFYVTDNAAPLRELFTVFKVSSRPIMRRMRARPLTHT